MRFVALVLCCCTTMPAFAQVRYDLLLKGGHVIDPKNGIDAVRDVAIKDHKIAAVAANIPAAQADKTVDVTGLYVTPGLVDIHMHVYAGTGERGSYAGDNSIYPDGFTLRNGVTTAADAGSSGAANFPDFKDKVIDRSKTRILAFLNIVNKGMRGGEIEQDVSDMKPETAAAMVRKYPSTLVGIKTAHYAGPDWTPVERAVEAGKLANVPVMVDFGIFKSERPYQDLVTKKLRPGDISTHCYRDAVPLFDEHGKLLPYLAQARKRGVIFDVGHGAGSFLFYQAVPAIQQGWLPDSISTDLHIASMNGGAKDMLSVMSRILDMGDPLKEVIRQSTWNPAREIKREDLGHLTVGAVADVAVLRVEKGNFGFVDSYGGKLTGTQKLVCELTVKDGIVLYDLNGITREDWRKLPKKYGAQGDVKWDGTISPATREMTAPTVTKH